MFPVAGEFLSGYKTTEAGCNPLIICNKVVFFTDLFRGSTEKY